MEWGTNEQCCPGRELVLCRPWTWVKICGSSWGSCETFQPVRDYPLFCCFLFAVLTISFCEMKGTHAESKEQCFRMLSSAYLPRVYFTKYADHELNESCHSVTFIVLVNSHRRWKQTRNRVCFHLWCELTLALWCHSIVWSLFLMK